MKQGSRLNAKNQVKGISFTCQKRHMKGENEFMLETSGHMTTHAGYEFWPEKKKTITKKNKKKTKTKIKKQQQKTKKPTKNQQQNRTKHTYNKDSENIIQE